MLPTVVPTNSATLAQKHSPPCPVTHLPFVPVCCLKHRDSGLKGCQLICIGLHTDAGIESQRQQVVNNLGRTEEMEDQDGHKLKGRRLKSLRGVLMMRTQRELGKSAFYPEAQNLKILLYLTAASKDLSHTDM